MKAADRRGVAIVAMAVLLVVLLGMVAFAIDVGFMVLARTQLQVGADAGALAGAAQLPQGQQSAAKGAQHYVDLNVTGGAPTTSVVVGAWDAGSRKFAAGGSPADAVKVITTRSETLFFGRVLGSKSFSASAEAVAICRPRDIVLVLDFSGSMNSHHRIDELKKAVDIFFNILDKTSEMDRVGFVRFATQADLEVPLTHDFRFINQIVQKTKATGWTNIGDGMNWARLELTNNSRPNAVKMMVVMTDGHVNRPANGSPRQYVIDQAQLAKDAGIEMVTISFGRDADKSLMQDVADICKGTHFFASDSVSEHELRKVFEKVAMYHPTALVQ